MTSHYDIFVIGGGINGCGIARDAAGRGYSVGLAEMNDLASGTSSWSTKLIHGGLRYLEHYEFRLVREALIEREVLWSMAPHIIWPLRFVLPHHKGLRPRWLLRIGLFLYDHLGGRKLLPATRTLDLTSDPAGEPLKADYTYAFEYSDCWVDDARLVVLNARDAAARGAHIRTRTEVVKAKREDRGWRITLKDHLSGKTNEVTADMIVNAAGPWVDKVLQGAVGKNDARNVRLVQGSHIVVPKLYDHDRCYIFQNADGRIFFSIPYEDDFTLIGTTDRDYQADPGGAKISEEEIEYLCDAANGYFKKGVSPDDIVWTYSGVRPLYDDGASKAQEATRDYVLKVDGGGEGSAPILNIFGGKITTYRRLAESVLQKVEGLLGTRKPAWTAGAKLPGGDFPTTGRSTLLEKLQGDYPFLPDKLARRLIRQYGSDSFKILSGAARMEDLGRDFGAGLYQRELDWLIHEEWALEAGDVAWRRSKLGLRLSDDELVEIGDYIKSHRPAGDMAAE